ncbi:hypothetical protein ACI6QG_06540 [Roseococcus sp. DSY-14]|uniref:hypothetical protein n=1 Tax=Roseococcus sp. DSY-14 TaxID=3369650 RepID=UPI00387AB492
MLLAAAALLAPPPPAEARTRAAARRQAKVAQELRIIRRDAIAPPEDIAGGEGGRWSLDLQLPLLWNANPGARHPPGRGDVQATPEARLGWSHRPAAVPLRLAATLDAAADRYGRSGIAGSDTLFLRLRAQRESGRDDQEVQPFVMLQSARDHEPGWGSRLESRHDLTLGAAAELNLDRSWRRVPRGPDTRDATAWSLGLNLGVQRRWREEAPPSLALVANPSAGWTPHRRFTASLELEAARRWHARDGQGRRRDWLAAPVLTLEWLPAEGWLPGWLGAPAVNLQVFGARQWSSRAEWDFRQGGAGPLLRTTWRF